MKVAPLTNQRMVELIKQSFQIKMEMALIRDNCNHQYEMIGVTEACKHCGYRGYDY